MTKKKAKKAPKVFNVLAIDDDLNVLESLTSIAEGVNIKLLGVQSLNEAQELIKNKRETYFHGFILDIVCNVTKEQTAPDPSFLAEAIKYIDKTFPGYPRRIITGHSGHYNGVPQYYKDEKFVEKADYEAVNSMFAELRQEMENLREQKIIAKYSDVFEILDLGLLGPDTASGLLETFKQMDNYNPTNIKDNLARVRRIFESVFIEISKRREDIITESLLKGPKNELIDNLVEAGHMDGIIQEFSYKVWKLTSSNGSHASYESLDYPPTKYTVQSIVYALLDILLWMKKLLS